jgi:hypothetical protein
MVRLEGTAENSRAGLDLLRAVRESKPELPFVFMVMSDRLTTDAVQSPDVKPPLVVVTASPTELIAALKHFSVSGGKAE